MPVGPDAFGPFGFVLRPNGAVVVDEVRQVVLHQIFSGGSHIHGIPKFKFPLHVIQRFLFDAAIAGVFGAFEEYVVPYFGGELFGFNT